MQPSQFVLQPQYADKPQNICEEVVTNALLFLVRVRHLLAIEGSSTYTEQCQLLS